MTCVVSSTMFHEGKRGMVLTTAYRRNDSDFRVRPQHKRVVGKLVIDGDGRSLQQTRQNRLGFRKPAAQKPNASTQWKLHHQTRAPCELLRSGKKPHADNHCNTRSRIGSLNRRESSG